MVTFNSKITKKGNIKVSKQLREILALSTKDRVMVTIECGDPNELRIPQEYLKEAGIPEDSVLEVFAEDGCVVIQEACDD